MSTIRRCLSSVIVLLSFAAVAEAAAVFRVTPYVQHPSTDAMTLKFISDSDVTATVSWWKKGNPSTVQSDAAVAPVLASDLQYYGDSHAKQYLPEMTPYMYTKRITGLAADTEYEYSVTLAGGPTYAKSFRTAPSAFRPVRFVCYADSETEPASNGSAVTWDNFAQDADTNPSATSRKYLVDQTVGYASNICTMVSRKPDFFVIAGDLVQTGSKQTHWDEFWRHNAGKLNDPAGSIPIMAALGNHEYSSYSEQYGEQGAKKFLSYFEFEPNTAAVDADQKQRFHRLDYGPIAVIFIDPNNGPDNEPPADTAWSWAWEYAHPHERDTNAQLYYSRIDGGVDKSSRVPQFQEGSAQYKWLEEQLADAQTNKLFTFLVCHQCPYSAGYHGRASGELGRGGEAENLSGVPTRCLTNLVFKYGVDAWICGHDEMYEHSQVQGEETLPDGTKRPTTLNVYDIGIGGDGLRGCRIAEKENPQEVFRAHVDAPEVYDNGDWQTGTLVSGGKHYGHLEVNVETNEVGQWTAKLTPVYNFVSKDASTDALTFDRRTYPDEIVVTNLTYSPVPPTPPTPADTAIHVETTGNDETGDGTAAKLSATVAKPHLASDVDDVIKLGEGTFRQANELTVDKAVTIEGAGKEATVLTQEAGKTGFRCLTLSHDKAVVKNLQIYNYVGNVGGLAVSMSKGTLDNVWIYKNKMYCTSDSLKWGCGVSMSGGLVTNSVIEANWADRNYGSMGGIGAYMDGGTLVDSVICGNYRKRREHCGAGVYVNNKAAKVIRCLIEGNGTRGASDPDKQTLGMGLYMKADGLVDCCRIVDNDMQGVYMTSGTLRNSLVSGHKTTSTSYAAGVNQTGGTLVHCTVTANEAPTAKAGFSMSGGTAVNNIVYANGTVGDAAVSGGTCNTNLFGNVVAYGIGNFVSDPKFADPSAGDFRLSFGSSAIDGAAPRSDMTVDLVGTARPQGTAGDLGCYEFVSAGGPLQCATALSASMVGEDNAMPTARSQVAGGDGTEITYAWYLDDTLVVGETGPTYTPVSSIPGHHAVKLVVSQGGVSVASEAASFDVLPYEVYVDVNGASVFPYNTPEKAACAFADAAAALWSEAGKTSRIHVAAGEYELLQTASFGQDVRVLGAGRDETVLKGGRVPSTQRGFYLNHASARLQDLTVTGFTNNLDGAGVYLKNGTLANVRLTRIYQQTNRDNQGCAVYMESGTVTNALIDHNFLEASYQGTRGHGICMDNGLVVDTTVCWNTMKRNQHHGLGIYAKGSSVIRRCTIYKNYSTVNEAGDVDGLFLEGTALAEDCNVYSNGMNGVHIKGGTLRNSVVYGHYRTGDYFSGVRLESGSLVNCTISDNTATGDTTGKSGLYQSGGTAVNNVIYGNGNATLGSCYVTKGTFTANVTDKQASDGGFVADPKFINAATNDFRLAKGSPAIDKATDVGLDHDLDGRARPLGDGFDIGCYEAVPVLDPVVAISAPVVSVKIGGTIAASADLKNIDVATAKIIWQLTGAATETVEGVGAEYLAFSHPDAIAGAYSLMLSVVVDEETHSADAPTAFTVKPTEVYVAHGGTPTYPYDTPEKATENLNEALEALWQSSSATTTAHVAAGDYVLHDVITLQTPVRILGAGRDETRLHGTDIPSAKRAFALKDKDVCLADFTLCGVTNTVGSGGVAVRMEEGHMENVRVTGTWAKPNGSSISAVGLYLESGTVTNCVFDHNSGPADYGWTSGLGVYMTGGLLVDCEISDSYLDRYEYSGLGLYITGGTARRCKIHHITAWRAGNTYGAGLAVGGNYGSGTVEDCIISDCTYGAFVSGSGTLRNSVVANCQGSTSGDADTVVQTGGVIQEGGSVVNCTMAGNGSVRADRADYLVSVSEISKGVSKNNIAQYAKVVSDRLTQAGNVFNVDPKIKNAKAGKYRLMAGSPAIGAADPTAWTWSDLETAKDVLGNPRVYHFGKSDERFDCGACTYFPTGLTMIVR